MFSLGNILWLIQWLDLSLFRSSRLAMFKKLSLPLQQVRNTAFVTSNSTAKGFRRARSTLLALCPRDVAAAIALRRPAADPSHRLPLLEGSGSRSRSSRYRSIYSPTEPPGEGEGSPSEGRQDLLRAVAAGYSAVLNRISRRVSELPLWALPWPLVEAGLQAMVSPGARMPEY